MKIADKITLLFLTLTIIITAVALTAACMPSAKIRFLFFVMIFLVLLTLWSAGLFLSRIVIEPLGKLLKGAEAVEAGNLDYKVGTIAKDEIGRLSRSFDQMNEKLKRSRNQVNSLTITLEAKVKERTKELDEGHHAALNILEDLAEAKSKAEEAMKIKSDFTSTVSHELRTPLTAIRESIAIVLDGSAGAINAEQKDFLNTAKRNVDRLARLINDVLDLQKLGSGKMTFDIRENDINEVINEVRQTMRSLMEQKGLDFILQLDESLPRVKFDRDKIIQVLTNLVNNAIKFTERGSISIVTNRSDNGIQVSVQDTGPGIKKEDIPRLFQQFEQLEKGDNRKTGGTGLGLAISKEIIQRHGGRIWAAAELGKGTAFCFILPV